MARHSVSSSVNVSEGPCDEQVFPQKLLWFNFWIPKYERYQKADTENILVLMFYDM